MLDATTHELATISYKPERDRIAAGFVDEARAAKVVFRGGPNRIPSWPMTDTAKIYALAGETIAERYELAANELIRACVSRGIPYRPTLVFDLRESFGVIVAGEYVDVVTKAADLIVPANPQVPGEDLTATVQSFVTRADESATQAAIARFTHFASQLEVEGNKKREATRRERIRFVSGIATGGAGGAALRWLWENGTALLAHLHR